MSGATAPQLSVTLTALDQITPVLARVGEVLGKLEAKLTHVAHASHEAEHESEGAFGRMREHVAKVGESVGELRERIGGVFERVTEMIPALAGLGTIGAVGGVFELVAGVAEAREKIGNLANTLGLSRGELLKWNFVAKMSGVDTEAVAKGMSKFGIALAGGNKSATGLFAALHIRTRDAKGQVRAVGDVFKDVMTAFERNSNPATRELLAKTLFGKGGVELIPLLTQSREEVERLFAEFERVKVAPSEEQAGALEEYGHKWKLITAAVDGVKMAIANRLAPVLLPVLEKISEVLINNRGDITEFVGRKVEALVTILKKVDWEALGEQLSRVAEAIGTVFDKLGGIKGVLELMIASTLLKWTAGFVGSANTIVDSLAGVIAAVARVDQAIVASTMWKVAGALGLAFTLSGDTPRGDGEGPQYHEPFSARPPIRPGDWKTFWEHVNPFGGGGSPPPNAPSNLPPTVLPALPGMPAPDGSQAPINPFAPDYRSPIQRIPSPYAPTSGAAGFGDGGRVDITLSLPNLPPGATVDARSTGIAGPVRVNTGQAFGGLYGDQ